MKTLLLFLLSVVAISFHTLAQNNCVSAVITQVNGGGTYCRPNSEITLEVSGTLNGAAKWTWYSDSCGGTSVGTGTALKVIITKNTKYFVRGTGGCVADTAKCSSTEVNLDVTAPEVTSGPEDMVVPNDTGECGAIVTFDEPKGMDECSDTVFVKRVAGLDPGSFFPVGVTEEKYELSDYAGNKTYHSFKVKVEDKELPFIVCAKDTVVNNEARKCGAIVTYHVPAGTDNCPGAVTEQTNGLGSGAFFPVGVTTETYTVTDAAGNVDSCSFTVTVKDIEPPVIKVIKKETVYWPPNHKHHTVVIEDYIESVWDNCGGITIEDVVVDQVGSDEPNNGKGDGNTLDDILISSDCDTTQLLAERSGNGNGRVYVITMAVMDTHGNIGTANFNVEVPHDKGKKGTAKLDSIIYVVNGCDLIFEEDSVEVNPNTNSPEDPILPDDQISEEETNSKEQKPKVYPNPFSGSFTVKFHARHDDHVKIQMYNLIGMKVADLYEQDVEAHKSYTWTLDAPSLNPNEYVLMIMGGKTRQFARVVQKK